MFCSRAAVTHFLCAPNSCRWLDACWETVVLRLASVTCRSYLSWGGRHEVNREDGTDLAADPGGGDSLSLSLCCPFRSWSHAPRILPVSGGGTIRRLVCLTPYCPDQERCSDPIACMLVGDGRGEPRGCVRESVSAAGREGAGSSGSPSVGPGRSSLFTVGSRGKTAYLTVLSSPAVLPPPGGAQN